MTALLKPLTDSTGFVHGAIVADDRRAVHLWAPEIEPWFDSKTRMRSLVIAQQNERNPHDVATWLDMALFGIAAEYTANSEITEWPNAAKATEQARLLFKENPTSVETVTAIDRALMHDFAAAGGDPDDPEQAMSLVTSLLGPIDPDGPNGWLLKAAAGEDYDKSDAWIRWTPEGDTDGAPKD